MAAVAARRASAPSGATERPSPNHDARPAGAQVDMLILHYTGMASAEAALARLCDPASGVGAHYLVDEDGTICRLVSEERRAWHAGVSVWRGRTDVNAASIGVEIANPGHELGYRPFPEAQMAAAEELCRDIVARHPIPARHVLGHSDVAPARRADPGELFDWRRLAAAGVGLWPEKPEKPEKTAGSGGTVLTLSPGAAGPKVAEIQRAFAEFGYGVPVHGAFDEATAVVATAFQRHFRPRRVDGAVDPETAEVLFELVARA